MLKRISSDFQTEKLATFDQSWHSTKLDNGLTLLHVPTNNDRFYLSTMIKSGSRLETGSQAGISHFLEHMMFRGSKNYPSFSELASAFEWLGGEWNAATGQEHTEYWYSGINRTSNEIIDLFYEFLSFPAFQDIETERKIILREIEGELNDHGHSTDLEYHLANLLWPGSTLALPILGTEDTVDNIHTEHLLQYRKDFYFPENMAICAVGGERSTVMKRLTDTFSNYQGAGKPRVTYLEPTTASGPRVKWVEHSDNELNVLIAFKCSGEWSEISPHYEIISRILCDGFCARLSKRIREELGLVYDIDTCSSQGIDSGTFNVSADVKPESLKQFLEETLTIICDLKNQGPTDEEFERAILRAQVDLELAPTEPEDVSSKLSWSLLCDRSFALAEERKKISSINIQSLTATAQELFTSKNVACIILGPKGEDVETIALNCFSKYL